MPSSLLCTGSPQDVRDYTERLIDVVAKGGGYILDGDVGILDKAKPENVKAIIDDDQTPYTDICFFDWN